jgi:hypothetical protein
MSEKDFAETATEGELREFAGKIFKQVKVVRKAEIVFTAANDAEKEAKEKVKRLGNEKNELIEQLHDEPTPEEVVEIKNKRLEEMRAEQDASDKNSKKNEAKHTLAKEEKSLLEMIDESNDSQTRMDFDGAEEKPSVPDCNLPGHNPKTTDETLSWMEIPVAALDIPEGMKKPLLEIGVENLGHVRELVLGRMTGYEKGPISIKGWGEPRALKLMNAVHAIAEEQQIEHEFEAEEESEDVPSSLEEQFPLASSDAESYVDVDDDEEDKEMDEKGEDDLSLTEIRITNLDENNELGLSKGDEIAGVKAGGKVTVTNSKGSMVLLPHEYELIEAAVI